MPTRGGTTLEVVFSAPPSPSSSSSDDSLASCMKAHSMRQIGVRDGKKTVLDPNLAHAPRKRIANSVPARAEKKPLVREACLHHAARPTPIHFLSLTLGLSLGCGCSAHPLHALHTHTLR